MQHTQIKKVLLLAYTLMRSCTPQHVWGWRQCARLSHSVCRHTKHGVCCWNALRIVCGLCVCTTAAYLKHGVCWEYVKIYVCFRTVPHSVNIVFFRMMCIGG